MSDNIDILINIDVASLPNLSQDKNHPTGGLNSHVYMVVTSGQAISGNLGPELNIKANIGDNVRWRAQSLSSNFEYSVMLYNFTVSSGNELLSQTQLLGGVKGSHIYSKTEEAPVQGDMPLSGQPISTPYNFYQSTVEDTGTVTYQWWFQINDTNDGSLVGYGMWDPFITIRN